jgi:hypothetical protein
MAENSTHLLQNSLPEKETITRAISLFGTIFQKLKKI